MSQEHATTGQVLLVDDEESNLELLARSLRSLGPMILARSLAEAREQLGKHKVHVVVSDHRLPDGLGTEFLAQLAREQPGVGRVLVTGYGDSREVIEACNTGVVERFFVKPYSPPRLKSAVLELLRRQGVARSETVLLADDDQDVRTLIKTMLKTRQLEVHEAVDGDDAIKVFSEHPCDIALIDMTMPKRDGLVVLKELTALDPDLPVLVVTGADASVGLSLLEAGAFDFISKPVRLAELILRVEHAIWTRHQLLENRRLLKEVEAHRRREAIVVESEAMKTVLGQVQLLGKHDVSVLVTGETGTGKEVIARLLHKESRRSEGPFIPVNCGAIPDNLIESQLFGHEKGAFTDAKTAKHGFFVAADEGTLFLDEVGELSPGAQVRLLRALEQKEVTPVGSTKPIKVDVRVVAATHRDLEAMVKDGQFRQDLFYRLNGFLIRIPPLRERPSDIPPLMEMAVVDFCARNKLPPPEIGSAALKQARAYEWPGNVRELLHVIERTLITRGPTRIDELDLPKVPGKRFGASLELDDTLPLTEALDPVVAELEQSYLKRVLKRAGGRLGRAAEHAGIHRKSLYNKLKRYGISVEALEED